MNLDSAVEQRGRQDAKLERKELERAKLALAIHPRGDPCELREPLRLRAFAAWLFNRIAAFRMNFFVTGAGPGVSEGFEEWLAVAVVLGKGFPS